jgi:hypothetical protein
MGSSEPKTDDDGSTADPGVPARVVKAEDAAPPVVDEAVATDAAARKAKAAAPSPAEVAAKFQDLVAFHGATASLRPQRSSPR